MSDIAKPVAIGIAAALLTAALFTGLTAIGGRTYEIGVLSGMLVVYISIIARWLMARWSR